MRKAILIALAVLLALSLTVLTSCNKSDVTEEVEKTQAEIEIAASNAENTELEFIYVSDTHFMREEEVGDYTYQSFINREKSTQKMNFLSEAIFKQFCDDVIKSGIKLLLIGGDLNESGSKEGHIEIAAQLDRVRAAGVTVYVVPGNHDCYAEGGIYTSTGVTLDDGVNTYTQTTFSDFASIYANYGYSGTNRMETEDMSYTGCLSYSVDLNSKYTLIAFDNCSSEDNPDADALDWVVNQVAATVAAGKTPLLMMHRPLMEIFTGIQKLANLSLSGNFVSNDKYKNDAAFGKALYNAGLQYAFVGHMHSSDLMLTDYAEDDGKLGIFQLMNDTLTDYNCGYFDVKFKPGYVDVSTLNVLAPNEGYLPSYITEQDRREILNGWDSYVYNYTMDDFAGKIYNVKTSLYAIVAEYVVGTPLSDMSADDKKLIIGFVDGVYEYLDSPIYATDSSDGKSLEELFEKYGFTGTLPEVSFSTNFDVILDVITSCFSAGNKELTVDGAQWKMIKYVVYGLFISLAENDLFGLMEHFGLIDEEQNVDTTPMFTRLLNEGVLDISTYNAVDNLLSIAVVSELDGVVGSLVEQVASKGLLSVLPVALNLLQTMMGINMYAFFITDEVKTAAALEKNPDSTKVYLSGEIYLDKLLDEFVFEVLGKGLLYDPLCDTQDVVINRSTYAVYDK